MIADTSRIQGPYRCRRDVGHEALRYISDELFFSVYDGKANRPLVIYIDKWRVPYEYPDCIHASFCGLNDANVEKWRSEYICKSRNLDKKAPIETICVYREDMVNSVRYDDINVGTEFASNEQIGSIYFPHELLDEPIAPAFWVKIKWPEGSIGESERT